MTALISAKKLSGWLRLWLAIAVSSWVIGAGYFFIWPKPNGTPPLPIPVPVHQWYHVPCDAPYAKDAIEIAKLQLVDPEYWALHGKEIEPAIGGCAQPWSFGAWRRSWLNWFSFIRPAESLFFFGPFIFGMALLAIGWVRRGFARDTL